MYDKGGAKDTEEDMARIKIGLYLLDTVILNTFRLRGNSTLNSQVRISLILFKIAHEYLLSF